MTRTIVVWLVGALVWIGGTAVASAQSDPSQAQHAAPEAVAGIIELPTEGAAISLDGRSRYWLDSTGLRTVEQVEAQSPLLPWSVRTPGQQYRVHGQALWFEFDVANTGSHRWYLQIAASGLDRAQFFYRDANGQWVVQEAGDSRPVSSWTLPGRVPAFELSDARNTGPVRYWLRIEHERVDFAAPMALVSEGLLIASRETEQLLLGAYFGLALLIALVAAANAFAFRDRNFGVYAVYVLTMGIGQAAYLGIGSQYLWDGALEWNQLSTFVLPALSAAAALWFVQTVTEPARFSRTLSLAVWCLIAAVLLAIALDAWLASRASFALVMALMALSMVMVALLIGVVWLKGEDPDVRLIALGFLPVLVMAAFPLARSFSLIPSGPLTRYGITIGAALEMPILFYALSIRGVRRREGQLRAAALSRTDALTGLADARTLTQRLDDALARARSQKHSCALLAVRIANFDALRQEYGNETGDRALVVAASHLRNAIADIDLAARVGIHEFVLLIEGPTTPEVAVARAQQLVASGLRHSAALPPSVTLKFHVALALLPDRERDHNATTSLKWLVEGVNAIGPHARKLIRPLNF